MALDERLRRELERAARPADPAGVYEDLIRRRERRRVGRKVQGVALALVVVAGCLAGVYALSRMFDPSSEGRPGTPTGSGNPIPSVAPSPEPSPSPHLAEGAIDIGIGFPVCFAEQLGRIDHLGDGASGNAWTGVPAKDDGTCPEFPAPEKFLLAADHTGDGVADSWIDLPFACYVGCQPVDATDLDANGTEELVVTSLFSIMDYSFFTVLADGSGELQIQPILVADPGHEPAGIAAGEPLRIDAGGDAGYGSAIECEGYPADPVIVWSWGYSEVESGDPVEVHVTRLELRQDGLFHVVDATDSTVPAGGSSGISTQAELGPECGVDWYP